MTEGSHRILKCPRRSVGGFTLVEMLMVLLVIAVAASMVALSVTTGDRERSHERYLNEIDQLIREGYARARLERQDYALQWYRDEIRFYALNLTVNEDGDDEIQLEASSDWQAPDTLEFQLEREGQPMMLPLYPGEPPEPDAIHIRILPDGTSDGPWRLGLIWASDSDGSPWRTLVSDGFNSPQWRQPDE